MTIVEQTNVEIVYYFPLNNSLPSIIISLSSTIYWLSESCLCKSTICTNTFYGFYYNNSCSSTKLNKSERNKSIIAIIVVIVETFNYKKREY